MIMYIGVDIGGTKIAATRVDASFRSLQVHRVPSQIEKGREVVLNNIVSCIRAVWDDSVQGIGVGVPGYTKNGVVQFGPNTGVLVGLQLQEHIEHAFSVPVHVENDANCFALAEHRLGAGKGYHHLLAIVLGTGVGGAHIVHNRLYHGESGSAGEIGHLHSSDGREWEELLSGPAFVQNYVAKGGSNMQATPQTIWTSQEDAATRTRKEVIEHLSLFIANFINDWNPQVIVLGGGISNLPFYDAIRARVKELCVPGAFEACEIKKHALGDTAGAIGAALLFA